MIIDTHCHYNSEPLLGEIEKHWQNSLNNNVIGGICVGTDLENSKVALKMAKKFPNMFASIGIHPEEYSQQITSLMNDKKDPQESLGKIIINATKELEKIISQELNTKNPQLVAIGEIGLDYYKLKIKGVKRDLTENLQKQIFLQQLKLAFVHQLPVILHVRDQVDRTIINAYYDTYKIVNSLITEYIKQNKHIPPIILHCVSGPNDYVENFIKLGCYVGFAGNITYQNAQNLRDLLKIIPKNRILLETDAPYLAPNEKKGQVCEPHFIIETANFLQTQCNVDLDIIFENTLRVFPQFKE